MAKKILVIEDDRDIADLVKLVLETTSDFVVETVLDPEDCISNSPNIQTRCNSLRSFNAENGWMGSI